MSFRVVAVSDLHVDARTRGLDRSADVLAALGRAVDHANEVEADLFCFLGDLREGHDPDERVWALDGEVRRHLERLECQALLLAGNHDVVDRMGGHSSLWSLQGDRVTVSEDVEVLQFGSRPGKPGCLLHVLCLPHVGRTACGGATPQAYVERRAADLLFDVERPMLAIVHHEVPGARAGGEVDMVAGEQIILPACVRESPEVSVICAGHIHEGQDVPRLPSGAVYPSGWDPDIHIVGSAERLTFGEEGQPKSLLVLDLP